jgi:hypothetical protein
MKISQAIKIKYKIKIEKCQDHQIFQIIPMLRIVTR